jgi:hypothetical protein
VFGNATEFLWKRPVGGVGYEIRRHWTNERLLVARPDARLEEYAPLREEPALFMKFSETEAVVTFREEESVDEGILGFVNRYGLLGGDAARGRPVRRKYGRLPSSWYGDAPRNVRTHVLWIREAIRLWDLVRRGDQKGLAASFRWEGADAVVYRYPEGVPDHLGVTWGEREVVVVSREKHPDVLASLTPGDLVGPAQFRLHQFVNARLCGPVSLKLVRRPEDGRDALDVLPDSLLPALWLQLALAIAGKKEYRRCSECGRPFELGPGGSRTSRLTCSAACRNRAYRERQERARQLHAAGKTFKQIAKELDSDLKTVKGWVTGRREK